MKLFNAFFGVSLYWNLQSVIAQDLVGDDTDDDSNQFKLILENLHREPISGIGTPSRTSVNTSWITQKLDHFNDSDSRTWQMRYKSNDIFFEDGGPILIFVGAEWEITDSPLKTGPIFDLAMKAKGHLFYTEHRYYGKSHPTKDLSLKNMKYLKIEQSLADLAHFIRTMRTSVDELANSKVILIGGSLSAAMVTWFQRVYPDLAVGGWASSGPTKFQVDFYEYKEVVGEAFQLVGGAKCYTRVQKAFEAFANGVSKKNKDIMYKVLKLCPSFNPSDKNDVAILFAYLADTFGVAVQNHKSGDIEGHCTEMLSAGDDAKGVASWIRSRLKVKKCLPASYKAMINYLKKTDWKTHKMARQWYYQICTQFGWFHTFNSAKQPFGNRLPMEYYSKMCFDVFGTSETLADMDERNDKLNEIYGGLNPGVKNIYYTHGYLDPWRPLGIQKNETLVRILKGYSHCKDLKARDDDTDEMLALRKDIHEHILKWLGIEKNDG